MAFSRKLSLLFIVSGSVFLLEVKPCIVGNWGRGCKYVCVCKDDKQCSQDHGHCSFGCKDGWMGPACNTTSCEGGFYGKICDKRCNCSSGVCDATTGECPHEKRACSHDPLMFGPKYGGKACDYRCFNNHCSRCDPKSAGTKCTECIGSYKFNKGTCEYECENDIGLECIKDCSPGCIGGQCDLNSKRCTSGCKPGFWGDDCTKGCGFCISHNGECRRDNGFCLGYHCAPGFKGQTCLLTCSLPKYGWNCSQTCSTHCKDHQCHHVHGRCLDGCELGFYGDLCNSTTPIAPPPIDGDDETDGDVISSLVGDNVLIAIIPFLIAILIQVIAIIICCCSGNKKPEPEEETEVVDLKELVAKERKKPESKMSPLTSTGESSSSSHTPTIVVATSPFYTSSDTSGFSILFPSTGSDYQDTRYH